MPKPYIPNKDIPIKIQPLNNQNNPKTINLNTKNKNNSSPKNVSKYITSKTKNTPKRKRKKDKQCFTLS